jgi:hypothetical protein
VEVAVEVVDAEDAGDEDTWTVRVEDGSGASTYTAPTEKMKTRPSRCFMGTRTVHNVRMGHRKMRKSLVLFSACAA